MSNKAFQQNLDDKKGPQSGGPYLIQMLFKDCLLYTSCALLEGELASNVLAALQEQYLPELAAEIAPDWDLPTEAVQSGLETLRSHLPGLPTPALNSPLYTRKQVSV